MIKRNDGLTNKAYNYSYSKEMTKVGLESEHDREHKTGQIKTNNLDRFDKIT